MRIDAITIFPDYFAPLQLSLLGKAQDGGLLSINVHDLRSQTSDTHHTVDDAPYGGGTCEMRKHRHMWKIMAAQICHFEFSLPKWNEEAEHNGEKKRVLVKADEKKCVFHLNTAWWSEYLLDYERHFLVTTMGTVNGQQEVLDMAGMSLQFCSGGVE